MSVRTLLEELRGRGFVFEVDGLSLRVDAPAETVTGEVREKLADNKREILRLLRWERRKLEEAGRRGLVIRWGRERGWIYLHDPTTGEWHEIKASECLPSVVESAKAHRLKHDGRG